MLLSLQYAEREIVAEFGWGAVHKLGKGRAAVPEIVTL
ncbi:hypothetical protein CPter291_4152 [Collimonas pratensis]|uniref:Uncharacterized protein n=1 Tax=Collimonas pratensis TaxID=279113 RepID=A0ABM5ZBD6_9BURK|nr:hypothetical protein CPter291_4152 [Collimonas pratensis]